MTPKPSNPVYLSDIRARLVTYLLTLCDPTWATIRGMEVLTLQQLSHKLRIDVSLLGMWMDGRTQISTRYIDPVMKALSISMYDLIGQDEQVMVKPITLGPGAASELIIQQLEVVESGLLEVLEITPKKSLTWDYYSVAVGKSITAIDEIYRLLGVIKR